MRRCDVSQCNAMVATPDAVDRIFSLVSVGDRVVYFIPITGWSSVIMWHHAAWSGGDTFLPPTYSFLWSELRLQSAVCLCRSGRQIPDRFGWTLSIASHCTWEQQVFFIMTTCYGVTAPRQVKSIIDTRINHRPGYGFAVVGYCCRYRCPPFCRPASRCIISYALGMLFIYCGSPQLSAAAAMIRGSWSSIFQHSR